MVSDNLVSCLRRQHCFCRALKDGPEWGKLSEARKRIVESELRDFVLGGVALEVDDRHKPGHSNASPTVFRSWPRVILW